MTKTLEDETKEYCPYMPKCLENDDCYRGYRPFVCTELIDFEDCRKYQAFEVLK